MHELSGASGRELFGHVVESSDDAIVIKSSEGKLTGWNRAAERLYGYTAEEAVGQPSTLLIPPDRADEERQLLREVFAGASIDHFETQRMRKDGERISVSLTISPVHDATGRIVSAAAIVRDITESPRHEDRLRHLAHHDQLTGLYNRRRFEEELKRELARAGRYGSTGAVIVLDLDNFRSINDSAGHAAGDAVLATVAGVLTHRFRTSDVCARLGGDEFAVLLPSVDVPAAEAAAEDLLAAIESSRPVFGGKVFRIGASIGVAAFEPDDATAGELMVCADLAMYAAKEAGRDRVVVYTASEGRRERATARFTWAQRFRDALERDGFVLHMQPILDLATDKVSHCELLLRMRGEHGTLIAPGAFLPAAERSGLIHAIDRWVVRRAIRMIAGMEAPAMPRPVSVNVSADSVVGDPHLLEVIQRELLRTAVDPSMLIFEVTETAAIANMREARTFARAVNELGSSLALDDFGTGFGSFYYLKHLPLTYVKLDGEFIQNLPRSEIDGHMVNAIVGIARRLGIKTVAESVTDEDTIRLLRTHGVDYAQGFHVGRPAPV